MGFSGKDINHPYNKMLILTLKFNKLLLDHTLYSISYSTVFNFFTGAGILASVLQDPAVKVNAPLHQHVSNIKGEGSKRATALKSPITSATPTATTR